MVLYSHLFKNFPQFVVIHTIKDFGIANKAEVDVFLELSCFFNDPTDVCNLTCGSSAFSKSSLGEFNSVDCYFNYSGQESLRRNGVSIIVNKRV